MPTLSKISPCLWFNGQAEEAATLYTSLFPDSRILSVDRSPAETPSGPKDMVLTVNFSLGGQTFIGLNGGPDFTFKLSRSRSRSTVRTRRRSIATGTRSSPAAASTASAAG